MTDGEAIDLAMTVCSIAGFSQWRNALPCGSEALEGFTVKIDDLDLGGDRLDLRANLLFAHGRQGACRSACRRALLLAA